MAVRSSVPGVAGRSRGGAPSAGRLARGSAVLRGWPISPKVIRPWTAASRSAGRDLGAVRAGGTGRGRVSAGRAGSLTPSAHGSFRVGHQVGRVLRADQRGRAGHGQSLAEILAG